MGTDKKPDFPVPKGLKIAVKPLLGPILALKGGFLYEKFVKILMTLSESDKIIIRITMPSYIMELFLGQARSRKGGRQMKKIHNEMPDAASPLSTEQYKKMLVISLIKMSIPLVFCTAVFCLASMAWFSRNTEVEASGVGIGVQGAPYTIQTQNSSGYYKEKWEQTGSDALEWLVSATNNFDNYEPDLEETEPGIEPGDSGVLEYRVSPNTSDSITVDCIFEVKAYLETVVKDEQGKVSTDESRNPITIITEVNDDTLSGYLNAHIMLFSGYDSEKKKYTGLIDNDQALRRVLKDQIYTKDDTAYTKIYWVWPMHLEDITSSDDSRIIYASEERATVINYIARNKNGFFKDCNNDETQVANDLTTLSQKYDNAIYNHYNMRYDNADLEIGNNISYVMLSMKVE